MMIGGRWKSALVMCLLWVAAAAVAVYLILNADVGADAHKYVWIALIFPAIILVFGMGIYTGAAGCQWQMPCPASDEEMSEYEQSTSLVGKIFVIMSFVAFLSGALVALDSNSVDLLMAVVTVGLLTAIFIYAWRTAKQRQETL